MHRRYPLTAAGLALLWIAAALSASRPLLLVATVTCLLVPALPALRRRSPARRRLLAAGFVLLGSLLGGFLGFLMWVPASGGWALTAMAVLVATAGVATPLIYAMTFGDGAGP